MQALGSALAYRGYIIRLAARGHFSPARPDEGAQGEGCRKAMHAFGPRCNQRPDKASKREAVNQHMAALRHCPWSPYHRLRRFPSQLDNLNVPFISFKLPLNSEKWQ